MWLDPADTQSTVTLYNLLKVGPLLGCGQPPLSSVKPAGQPGRSNWSVNGLSQP
jgi:hypothetical protein